MAWTGHSGMQAPQSMQTSGSMSSISASSWKQSTGQTVTQSVYLHFIQGSVTMWAMCSSSGKQVRFKIHKYASKYEIYCQSAISKFSYNETGVCSGASNVCFFPAT